MSQFEKITIMQFINIAIVILVVNFDLTAGISIFGISLFKGDYADFSV